MKENLSLIAPTLVSIVNSSFETSCFPDIYKSATIFPLLKKSSLSINELSNYRPVSNIQFFAKFIERCALRQLQKYCDHFNLLPSHQSAYRPHHSVETALLQVSDSIFRYLDTGKSCILLLLDLSAAFDTVDHNILLETISKEFGIIGRANTWLKSYLENRSFQVRYNNKLSNPQKLTCGVPQGSVLGPLLFSMYTSSLSLILQKHNMNFHFFADDTQLWLPFDHKSTVSLNSTLLCFENCLKDVSAWMNSKWLKLNPEKTEMLIISKSKIENIAMEINFDGHKIVPSVRAKNLGLNFDVDMSFHTHITTISSSCSYWLRNLYSLKRYLPIDSLLILVHAFITSRLDFCNSILINLPKRDIQRLQLVQNRAARLVTNTKRNDHITPQLFKLHWLPISFRIQYKLLILTHQCIYGDSPDYLSSLVSFNKHNYSTRLSNTISIKIPGNIRSSLGFRSFSYSAAYLWNHLPASLINITSLPKFKTELKTYLFKKAFSDFI